MSNMEIPMGDPSPIVHENLISNSQANLFDSPENEELDPELILQQILDDPNLLQHVTRTVDDGRETVIGYFRIRFEPNQLRQILHVPFAPALKNSPTIDAHVTDQEDIRIRVTDSQKFGTRIELIRSSSSNSDTQVLVEVIATET